MAAQNYFNLQQNDLQSKSLTSQIDSERGVLFCFCVGKINWIADMTEPNKNKCSCRANVIEADKRQSIWLTWHNLNSINFSNHFEMKHFDRQLIHFSCSQKFICCCCWCLVCVCSRCCRRRYSKNEAIKINNRSHNIISYGWNLMHKLVNARTGTKAINVVLPICCTTTFDVIGSAAARASATIRTQMHTIVQWMCLAADSHITLSKVNECMFIFRLTCSNNAQEMGVNVNFNIVFFDLTLFFLHSISVVQICRCKWVQVSNTRNKQCVLQCMTSSLIFSIQQMKRTRASGT